MWAQSQIYICYAHRMYLDCLHNECQMQNEVFFLMRIIKTVQCSVSLGLLLNGWSSSIMLSSMVKQITIEKKRTENANR